MDAGSDTPEQKGIEPSREFSSFRDPSGYLFWHNGEIHRLIDSSYARTFAFAQTTGLYAAAVDARLLLPFETVSPAHLPAGASITGCVAVLKPQQLSMVSYPYEWSFEQLKDAAIATLQLQILALERGALLKDASAYNIQFVAGRPIIIDHLSFDMAADHVAWPAYGQFCRHFLSPLLLMAYVDLSFARILQLHIDGPPLDLVSKLLPKRTLLSPGGMSRLM